MLVTCCQREMSQTLTRAATSCLEIAAVNYTTNANRPLQSHVWYTMYRQINEFYYGPFSHMSRGGTATGNSIHQRLGELQSHFTEMTFLNTSAFRASHLNNRQLQTQSIISITQATSNQNMYSILSYCLPKYTFTVQLEKLKGQPWLLVARDQILAFFCFSLFSISYLLVVCF